MIMPSRILSGTEEGRVDTKAVLAPKERRRRRATHGHSAGMFNIITLTDSGSGMVYVVGRPRRKQVAIFLNIPISQELKEQLKGNIVGSMAMGAGALLEWAL